MKADPGLEPPGPAPPPDLAAMGWALLGVASIFAYAVVRLGTRGIATIGAGLDGSEWLTLAAVTVFTVYSEGVRALQRRWVPRFLQRVAQLRTERRMLCRVLAPLYALSLIAAPQRALWRAWMGVAAIVAAVLVVRRLPEPWRGIVDFAVAVSLAWGLAVILAGALRLLTRRPTAATD